MLEVLLSGASAPVASQGRKERGKSVDSRESKLSVCGPARYRIRVQGLVGKRWSDYYGGMTLECDQGEDSQPVTTLCGELMDQGALIGALSCLYNMRLPILSVEYIPERRYA
jgi:hypothetical protein